MKFSELILVVFIFLSPLSARTQSTPVVKVTDTPDINIKEGEKSLIKISFQIAPGFHIMAGDPGNESFIPTRLKMTNQSGFTFGNPVFPESHSISLDDSSAVFNVFDGKMTIMVPFTTIHKKNNIPYSVNGVLSYQSCDKKKCYFPRETTFTVYIRVI